MKRAICDKGANCYICGEAGRCPGQHHATEIEKAFAAHFAAVGVCALYGGRKGHGFWLYLTTADAARAFHAANGWSNIPGECITNDGKRSGNPSFWLMRDAIKLLEAMRLNPILPPVEMIAVAGSEPEHLPYSLEGGAMVTSATIQRRLF